MPPGAPPLDPRAPLPRSGVSTGTKVLLGAIVAAVLLGFVGVVVVAVLLVQDARETTAAPAQPPARVPAPTDTSASAAPSATPSDPSPSGDPLDGSGSDSSGSGGSGSGGLGDAGTGSGGGAASQGKSGAPTNRAFSPAPPASVPLLDLDLGAGGHAPSSSSWTACRRASAARRTSAA